MEESCCSSGSALAGAAGGDGGRPALGFASARVIRLMLGTDSTGLSGPQPSASRAGDAMAARTSHRDGIPRSVLRRPVGGKNGRWATHSSAVTGSEKRTRVPAAELTGPELPPMIDERKARVALGPAGLTLGHEKVPLLSGSVDYFRLPRAAWQGAVDELKGLGARLVDIAIPWSVHEKARGVLDFGEDNPRLDVVHFIELSARAALRTIAHLGPGVGAELTFGGIPERVVWDEACQARSPTLGPLMVAALPLAYPAPSQARRAFHDEAALWLGAAAAKLAPPASPAGPRLLCYVGDESRAILPTRPYDRDYHPDAIAQYRRFLN